MAAKVFIDGQHGTTGLQIKKRLESHPHISLLQLPAHHKHDITLRQQALLEADIAIFCLPEDAAIDATRLAEKNPKLKIIDSSTAYRTHPDWVYGFPELTKNQRERICHAKRISNPGCYATGAISILRPLTEQSVLKKDFPLTLHAISGYSGGGKKLIEEMEDQTAPLQLPFFTYSLQLNHKHSPEIKKHSLLEHTPFFLPSVGYFRQGLIVNLPLTSLHMQKRYNAKDLFDIFTAHYHSEKAIILAPLEEASSKIRINPQELKDTDKLKIYIFENKREDFILICAVLDNLGKGAAGAAIQNLQLLLQNT